MKDYHPVVIFIYLLCILFLSMLTLHPIIVGMCLLSGMIFSGILLGFKELFKSLLYTMPMLILFGFSNPLFVSRGNTVLFTLFSRPFTLEAIVYGFTAGGMLMSVLYWFKCYNCLMTTDKFIYLFGRIIPKLSLVLSMTLNFIPRFKRQFKRINMSQKAMGAYSSKSYFRRIKARMKSLSVLITWALENSIETADSMRARGYGLKGRTTYSIFKWTMGDTFMLIVVTLLGGVCIALAIMPYGGYAFYPTFGVLDFCLACNMMFIGVFLFAFLGGITEAGKSLRFRKSLNRGDK